MFYVIAKLHKYYRIFKGYVHDFNTPIPRNAFCATNTLHQQLFLLNLKFADKIFQYIILMFVVRMSRTLLMTLAIEWALKALFV